MGIYVCVHMHIHILYCIYILICMHACMHVHVCVSSVRFELKDIDGEDETPGAHRRPAR